MKDLLQAIEEASGSPLAPGQTYFSTKGAWIWQMSERVVKEVPRKPAETDYEWGVRGFKELQKQDVADFKAGGSR